MTQATRERLQFLLETVAKKRRHLLSTTQRLFSEKINAAWVVSLEERPDLAERLDALVTRFGRLQDTLGDKLIPAPLRHLIENTGSNLDSLNRMEKLGLFSSVDDWIEARNLRNPLIHEHMNDPEEYSSVLHRAHQLVGLLDDTCDKAKGYLQERSKEIVMMDQGMNWSKHSHYSWSGPYYFL